MATPTTNPPAPRTQRIFFVEGNIGSGKTTFLKELMKAYPDMCQVIYEPLDEWRSVVDANGENILDHFYRDMSRTAYTFQSLAFLTRARSLESIDPTVPFVFVERSVFSDMEVFAKNCVANGAMSSIEWAVYTKWFDWMVQKLPLANASHIYLRCAPDISLQRLHHRNREEEHSIAPDYIRALHERHEHWLCGGDRAVVRNEDEDATGRSTPVGMLSSSSLPVIVLDATADFRSTSCRDETDRSGVRSMAAQIDATFARNHFV